jgi:copper transport protein
VTLRGRAGVAAAALLAGALAAPTPAWAHAALLRTTPEASGTVNGSPARVTLTYSEAVAPRFAIVSVTDADGRSETDGVPRAAPSDPTTLSVPLRHLRQGWYLVYWRVISADGHPVRGAFTFAVGPAPGPAPEFAIPSLSETAATPDLVLSRWAVFLTVMIAVGAFIFRAGIARPVSALAPRPMRALTTVMLVAIAAALVATPVYVLLSTAQFALRPWSDVGAVIPVVRDSVLGRAYLDLEAMMVLFAVAAAAALVTDPPGRRQRSVAALLALAGALAAAAAMMLVPGLAGHAAQTSPAALSLAADWMHLSAAAVWLGGLVCLVVLGIRTPRADRLRILGRVVPRFSRVASVSVVVVIASGAGAAALHLPTLSSLWQTSYGKAILAKVGLLSLALVAGGINYARTTPRLRGALDRRDTALGASAAALLRRLVATEVGLVSAIVLAAMVLSSLPPPARALAEIGHASARVGPGAVDKVVRHGVYTMRVRITPNRAATPSTFTVRLTRDGSPVRRASVIAHFAMLDMEMGTQAYTLPERSPGVYSRSAPALVMVGRWGLGFEVHPAGSPPFTVIVLDRAEG